MFSFLYTNLHCNTYIYQSMKMTTEFAKKKYFLEAYTGIDFRHGGIGGVDIENILRNNGYDAVRFSDGLFPFVQPIRWYQYRKFLQQLQPGDLLLAQFPVYPRLYQRLLRAALAKKVDPVIILMDIDGLKSGDAQLLAREIRFLQQFSRFVVHGENMERWLKANVPGANCSQLGPFDFLAEPATLQRVPEAVVNYSGNLHKSAFIFRLQEIDGVRFLLYGEGGEAAEVKDQVDWKGVFKPHELPSMAEGSFGLVWDGEGIDAAEGIFGDYMQYIFQHKISLYILAGLPIFIYNNAGAADYIVKERLGWKINSIRDLPAAISKIGVEEYQQVRENMKGMAAQIANGRHLLRALARFSS